jgi:hypothetical protein
MGVGNLVKEMPYINPPFAFPATKKKHKCISASARTGKFFFYKYFLYFILFSCPRRWKKLLLLIFPASVRTHLRVVGRIRVDGKKIIKK